MVCCGIIHITREQVGCKSVVKGTGPPNGSYVSPSDRGYEYVPIKAKRREEGGDYGGPVPPWN